MSDRSAVCARSPLVVSIVNSSARALLLGGIISSGAIAVDRAGRVKKYPNRRRAKRISFTGLTNARPPGA